MAVSAHPHQFIKFGIATVVVTVATVGCAYPGVRPSGGSTLTVTRVVDGDTVDMSNGQRVRLIGVDTPEAGTGSCADKATARLKQIVLGQQVKLTPGARDDKDKYGRLLRYVETAKYDAGRVLINEGLAIARYDSRDGYGTHTREAKYVWADSVTPNCANDVAPPPPPGGGCHPSYPGVCIPPAPPDLDCGDVPYRRFTVLAPDPHGFDGNFDGVGCESG
jgi:endonuclease YncB( thermonuclease family)